MPSLRARLLAVAILFAAALCVFLNTAAAPQQGPLHPIAAIPRNALGINPSVSGDGRFVAFETTADLPGVPPRGGFRAVRANTAGAPVFQLIGDGRAPAPALSQDGSRAAFSSKDDPLGLNRDGNAEIFFHDGASLHQITRTDARPDGERASRGNFQPSITDDGRLIAFSSNRDLTGGNTDGTLEIFLYDASVRSFSQLTETAAERNSKDAKISGDGNRLAFIRETNSSGSVDGAAADLVLFEIATGRERVVASGVSGLSFTYGRAVSDDGTRVVYSARTGENTTQVFLYDGRNNLVRQLTSLGPRASDVPLHPTISGDGNRVAFATRRRVVAGRFDGGVELYLYDIPTARLTQITDAPPGATAEVVSSLDDAGTLVAFSFPRVLADPTAPPEFANNQLVYLTSLAPRPPPAVDLEVVNGAHPVRSAGQFGAVSPDSIAVAYGSNLAISTTEAHRLPRGSFPFDLQGTTVTVNGRPAQIFFASPGQINFHVPAATETGTALVVARNPDGYEHVGAVTVGHAAPGIFTQSGNDSGEAVALDEVTLQRSPFDVTDAKGDPRRLIIFCTGLRNASAVSVTLAGRPARVEGFIPSPDLPGLDQLHVALSSRLRGAGTAPLLVTADGHAANPAAISITDSGPAPRPTNITITPPDATAPVGGELRFRAEVVDANGEEIQDAPVIFSSGDAAVATVDADGLVRALSEGATTITASAGSASAAARLRVLPRTLVINELLADPPDGLAGDANHDGRRNGSEDEFIELVNGTDSPLDLSGWRVRTRPLTGSSETTRHVFQNGASIPAGDALVIFGGGDFAADNPAFGGAHVVRSSSGALSLTNGGLTILIRDSSDNLVTQFSYGSPGDGLGGDSIDQSITRAPDITGPFARHAEAAANGTRYSPGVRLDGSFFLPRDGRLTRVELEPSSANIQAGQTIQFSARAFDHFGRPVSGAAITFTSSDTNVATVESVTVDVVNAVTKANVLGNQPGMSFITARAQVGLATVESPPATLNVAPRPPRVTRVEVSPPAGEVNRGGALPFTARAFDENDQPIGGVAFTWSSSNPDIATLSATDGLATGVGMGEVKVRASAPDGRGGTATGEATLFVRVPLVINEINADVQPDVSSTADVEGDANRDGVRNADDDEFVELVNNSRSPLDVSGIQLHDASNRRFTFPPNTTLAAGRATVVFGGGDPASNDPAFGGASTFTSSSLSLSDSGDTVSLKLSVGGSEQTITSLSYGAGAESPAPSDQSATRGPDAGSGQTPGAFVAHASALNAHGRRNSPGTRADGTPFDSPHLSRIEVRPVAVSVSLGASQAFSARAYGDAGGQEIEVPNVSFIWESSDAARASLAPSTGVSTNVNTHAGGSVTITARAGGVEQSGDLTVVTPTPTPGPTPPPTPTPTPTPSPSPTPATRPNVVISQLYGGAGCGSQGCSTYRNDFIEIFNRGGVPVSLGGWSVQYASASGSSWQVTGLTNVTLQPGQHYLVQEGGNANGTHPLPAPDATASIAMNATAGKVALVNSTVALSGPCPASHTSVVNFVGYGASANCFEGSGPAASPGNARSVVRKDGGCMDARDNAADFQPQDFAADGTPAPRNTNAPLSPCEDGQTAAAGSRGMLAGIWFKLWVLWPGFWP